MKQTKLNNCPRCNLPQEGVYSCQYCGYVFAKHEKKFARALRNRLKDIFPTFKKETKAPSKKRSTLKDNGGTRSGTDRRKYRFRNYYPENRSGRDRRKGIDRRRKVARKRWVERRFSLNHEIPYPRKT
jgi:hypothetical protein